MVYYITIETSNGTQKEETKMKKPSKKYVELTREEIDRIANTGGDAKTWLDNEVSKYLDKLELSQYARDIIDSADPVCEVFAGMWTAEEVETYILDNFFDQDELDDIAGEMNDEIREDLHAEMAGCNPIDFLKAYVERDPEFTDWLHRNKGIELD